MAEILIIVIYAAALPVRGLLYPAVAVHAAYVLYRGTEAGRLPVVGLYDTLLFTALSTAIFSLVARTFVRERRHFDIFTLIAVISFLLPLPFMKPNNSPLPPVLDTYWFEVHVVLSFFSYALFIMGGIAGVIFLSAGIPSAERLQYRTILVGYTFFSVAMIAGGIWAFFAWGTYWLWTPKEVWTTVLWLYYSLYLHMRLHTRLGGRPAAAAGIAGVAVMLFTYLGVGLLMKSSHSF